jgi:hypothetical protein
MKELVWTAVVRTCVPNSRGREWGRVSGEGGEITEVVSRVRRGGQESFLGVGQLLDRCWLR